MSDERNIDSDDRVTDAVNLGDPMTGASDGAGLRRVPQPEAASDGVDLRRVPQSGEESGTHDVPGSEGPGRGLPEQGGQLRQTTPWWKRILWGVFWVVAVLLTLAVVLYEFGGMWVRTPQMRQAYDDMVASGQTPELESALVIPIPGCVCHSDDPVQQAQHSVRHIRDCTSCH